MMDILSWIDQNLAPRICTSTAFFYDEMESQSGFSLPILYQPFDPDERWHWSDRGQIFDFLASTGGPGQVLLDFGPGDGWPSLLLAPFAREIVGVDGSQKRVAVCRENARRLDITNARFEHVPPGQQLPFADGVFDGITAASSIEQTPDPLAALTELYRVLRQGGRMRIAYEGLSHYRGGKEREADLSPAGDRASWLTLYDRCIETEQARMARIQLDMPPEAAEKLLAANGEAVNWSALTETVLEGLSEHVIEARTCTLTHPSGSTFVRWLSDVGFSQVFPSHNGGVAAARLFDALPPERRPRHQAGIDALLQPLASVVVELQAPLGTTQPWEPWITAVK